MIREFDLVPSAASISLLKRCECQPSTLSWGKWYRWKRQNAEFMRELALSYSE